MIHSGTIDSAWLTIGFLMAAWFYFLAFRPVKTVLADCQARWAALVVACLALVVLWHIRATLLQGLSLHLLGATLCTLVFGWRLALLPLTTALILAQITALGDWSTLGLNACLLIVWPVVFSLLVAKLVNRLPSNLFVFIFVGGFFGGAGTVVTTGWLLTLMLWLTQLYPWGPLLEDYASYWLLVAFSEAWLTGMLLTVMVVYRPELVRMFDSTRYIDNA